MFKKAQDLVRVLRDVLLILLNRRFIQICLLRTGKWPRKSGERSKDNSGSANTGSRSCLCGLPGLI